MENGSQLTVTIAVKNELGLYRTGGLGFPVRILDARRVYGRVDVLISPINGQGEKWVQADTVTLI